MIGFWKTFGINNILEQIIIVHLLLLRRVNWSFVILFIFNCHFYNIILYNLFLLTLPRIRILTYFSTNLLLLNFNFNLFILSLQIGFRHEYFFVRIGLIFCLLFILIYIPNIFLTKLLFINHNLPIRLNARRFHIFYIKLHLHRCHKFLFNIRACKSINLLLFSFNKPFICLIAFTNRLFKDIIFLFRLIGELA